MANAWVSPGGPYDPSLQRTKWGEETGWMCELVGGAPGPCPPCLAVGYSRFLDSSLEPGLEVSSPITQGHM